MIAWSAPPTPGQKVVPNMLVAYDSLRPGEDLAGYVNRQLKELMAKAKKFQLDLRHDTTLAGRPAIETVFQWDGGGGMLKQRQIYSLLPDGRTLTLVNTAALTDFSNVDSHFAAMMNSFGWDQGS